MATHRRGTRKTTRKKPRVGARTQVKRRLRRSEFVVYRDRKGRLRKPRRDLLLYAEVRSRKTGKRIGYLNKVKAGKPMPKRYSSNQRAFVEVAPGERFSDFDAEEELTEAKDLNFTLYSSDMLYNQIPESLWDSVNERVDFEGQIYITFDLRTGRGERIGTKGFYLDERLGFEQFKHLVVADLLMAFNQINIRMSPKKFAKRRRGVSITKALYVRVAFSGVG